MSDVVKWILVGWMTIGGLAAISMVGKPRKPLTGSAATLILALAALQIAAILIFWGAES